MGFKKCARTIITTKKLKNVVTKRFPVSFDFNNNNVNTILDFTKIVDFSMQHDEAVRLPMIIDSRRSLSIELPGSVYQPRSPFSCQPGFGRPAASAARLGQTGSSFICTRWISGSWEKAFGFRLNCRKRARITNCFVTAGEIRTFGSNFSVSEVPESLATTLSSVLIRHK